MRAMLRTVLILGAMLGGCTPVQMRADMDRPSGEGYASTGDIVVRIHRTDDLPNVFGRADLFGRTRERGFTKVRYMGDQLGRDACIPTSRRGHHDQRNHDVTNRR